MLITQSEKFQKFEFESLAGISSNTWQTKIGANRVHCEPHCSSSLKACSHAPGRCRGRPQLPLPWPEPWEVEGRRGTRPGPPLCLSSVCKPPTTVPSPAPTHSTPRPRQQPPSTQARPSRPVLPVHVASTTCAGHLLGAPVPDAPAYKNPRRSNKPTRPAPSYLPNTLTSPRSLSFDVAIPTGEVLDAEGAAAFDLPGASHRWELVEEPRRSRFCPSPSSSASSTHATVTVVFFTARRWAPPSPSNTMTVSR
jgi:hypothetical protein